MEKVLKENLDAAKKIIRKDWDYVFVIDGEVGSGKSVLAQQCAYYVSDGDFVPEEICYTPQEFREQILKSQKYNAIVFDEAYRGLSARAAMSATNKVIVSMLNEIRQKNLFIFVVLPSIWDVDKFISMHRCKGLFHVYTSPTKERGFFKFYNKTQLTWLIGNAQKMRYKYPKSHKFMGRFTKFYPLGEKEYKDKKEKSLQDYSSKQSKEQENKVSSYKRDYLKPVVQRLKDKFPTMKQTEICELLGVDRKTLHIWREGSD